MATGTEPAEAVTDRAHIYPGVLDEVLPGAVQNVERFAINAVEADHGRLKVRLGPMRGLQRVGSARVVVTGHALVQNVRPHYELGVEATANQRVAGAYAELALAV